MINTVQQQHSAEWFRDRLGIITGSKVGVLMKSGRSREDSFTSTARTYLYQLAGERILSEDITHSDDMLNYYISETTVQSKAMRFGSEQEATARSIYEQITGHSVTEVGLCMHSEIKDFGSSPDGIIEEHDTLRCLEIKCPSVGTFALYASEVTDADGLLKVNPDYYWQCQAHMACTGAESCDLVIFCPFVESPIHVVNIKANKEDIENMLSRVTEANEFVKVINENITKNQ